MGTSKVIVIGTATVDFLAVDLPALPDGRGDEFDDRTLVSLPGPPRITIGGNGGNTAYVLGRLGIPTRLVSPLGDDLLGRAVVDWLGDAGVTLDRVEPALTSTNYIATTVDGDRGSFFFPVEPDHDALIALAETTLLLPGDHVHLTGFPHPSREAMIAWLDAAGDDVTTSLDVGPVLAGYRLDDVEDILPRLTWLLGNDIEIVALTGDFDAAIAAIRSQVRGGVVVKRGRKGATVFTADHDFDLPAPAVDVTTTVGAGDTFDGGFLAALMRGRSPCEAAEFATAVVAVVLERGRGVVAAPTMAEIPMQTL
ncbi:MAG: carbohydrate kinase family protein [Acidobacteria bacterium]|nr:carbohydrate kinase family protein [Acidobacteriota bacterium]MCH8985276.1 carbohydrate kinase family protein [Acidobacteriota bacterium]